MNKALELAEILEQECLFSGIARREHLDYRIDAATELRHLDALAKEQAQLLEEREQELERLRAQRVPLTDEVLADCVPQGAVIIEREGERNMVAMTRQQLHEFAARAIEAAHGIHPLQRLADMSKEMGKKL